jgi:hypothetical protein
VARLQSLRHRMRVYGGYRRAVRRDSPEHDVAARYLSYVQLQTSNARQAACTTCPHPTYSKVFERIVDVELDALDMLMCVHDWRRKAVLGNVRDATIAELWNGERMREVRRLISQRRHDESNACRDCSLGHDGWF